MINYVAVTTAHFPKAADAINLLRPCNCLIRILIHRWKALVLLDSPVDDELDNVANARTGRAEGNEKVGDVV